MAVIVGWAIGLVRMRVGRGKLRPSYLDMFRYESPVEIGGRGNEPVDKAG